VSFSDGRMDAALRELIGWPVPAVPVTPAEKVADLRTWLADLRRRRAHRSPGVGAWTKDWRP
jgi:hypothetical protein